MKKFTKLAYVAAILLAAISTNTFAAGNCRTLESALGARGKALHTLLSTALTTAQGQDNGGLGFHMWGTLIATDGTVCAVAKTGASVNAQWLGSRVISAQKANTAILFSTDSNGIGGPGFALSTANLMAATQPGGSLYGLQFSNPVDTKNAYKGNFKVFGQHNDPLRNKRVGGINIFGGGLALYDATMELVGGLGVSGDTSCADHNIAWRTREGLGGVGSVNVPGGVGPGGTDGIIYDDSLATGFSHVTCGGTEDTVAAAIGADQ